MTCKNIIISENNSQITIVSDQKEVDLKNQNNVALEVESKSDLVELKENLTNVVEVINVNSASVNGFYETFSPAIGQTIFVLSNILSGSQVLLSKVFINGQKISNGTCYTIFGSILTLILPYLLDSTDLLEIYY